MRNRMRHGGGMMGGPMMDPRSRFFMALASDHRVKIIEALKDGEKSSAELISLLGLDPSVVSRHLMMLRNVGIVYGRKEGVTMYFNLSDKRVLKLIDLATQITMDWYMNFQNFFK